MKAKMLILISIWFVISAELFSLEITNNAAVIRVTEGTFVKVVDGYFENTEDGTLILEHNSSIIVDKDIKNFGTVILTNTLDYNESFIETKQDYINSGSTFINPFSKLLVRRNVINSGFISNMYLIEIGE